MIMSLGVLKALKEGQEVSKEATEGENAQTNTSEIKD